MKIVSDGKAVGMTVRSNGKKTHTVKVACCATSVIPNPFRSNLRFSH
jgi:hypothetical protein